ncbi:inhibin alpha chain [Ochotona curzoniae]|uniref:inhibin alpha chain n=1 Tax=Ochotona curzoniae TaxID=130825 RepID=UPI001B34B55E|nr:inhibin alpha chain [Ochotona curzoniae]
MVSQLPLLLLLLLCPLGGHGCHGPDVDRELILAKVRALFLDALGPPPLTGEGEAPAVRRLPRRHALGSFSRRNSEPEEEDVSQAILFPTTGASCEDQPAAGHLAQEAEQNLFMYMFRPSEHMRSHKVTSAQLWFHTGLNGQGKVISNSSEPLLGLQVLSLGGPMAVPMSLGQAPPRWAVLHLAASALPLLTQPVLVLLVRCPLCVCSARPETTPFLVAHTRAKPSGGGDRTRRSAPPMPWPWSPAALRLLQRAPEEPTAHDYCHRAALNITFQELGWDRWIVHPPSFIFHYCHGGCGLSTPADTPLPIPGVPATPVPAFSLVPGAQPCCAAIPGTMRSLRVRTTSDGGYSFKYEMVPNLLAQHCACI